MALQWIILTYVVAAEAATATLLTLPTPKVVKSRLVSLVSLILQPSLFIVPFSAFQLMDIYWKQEHRLTCTGETCTASERDRYEKSVYMDCNTKIHRLGEREFLMLKEALFTLYKAQRNVILCAAAVLLYWCIYRICNYYKDIQSMEEVEKGYKDQ